MIDEKIKTAAGKAPVELVPRSALSGPARVFGYGAKKYAPGNYYNASLTDGAGDRYVGAALRHLAEMQLPNGLHTPASLAARDAESGLPHIDHVICGLLMLRSIMVKDSALPVDPGIGLEPTTVAQRECATVIPGPYDWSELPIEALVRQKRVESGDFDVHPALPRTGPGDP